MVACDAIWMIQNKTQYDYAAQDKHQQIDVPQPQSPKYTYDAGGYILNVHSTNNFCQISVRLLMPWMCGVVIIPEPTHTDDGGLLLEAQDAVGKVYRRFGADVFLIFLASVAVTTQASDVCKSSDCEKNNAYVSVEQHFHAIYGTHIRSYSVLIYQLSIYEPQ